MPRAETARRLTAQIAGRPIGVMMGIGTALNPFTVRPSYRRLEKLSIAEQRARLRDPEIRRQILADKPSEAEVAKLAQFRQLIVKRWDKFFVMGDPPDYEPGPEKSVAAIAAREGRTPDEVAYDYITRGREPVPVLPGGELCHRRPRADPRDAHRFRNAAGPERRRRALHLDRRRRHAELHAVALGRATGGAGRGCRSNFWSSARPARPPISSASPTAAGSRPDCAPTST